jgi:uncharacterized membrane protein
MSVRAVVFWVVVVVVVVAILKIEGEWREGKRRENERIE